jgi:hypothetical protein
VLAFLLLLVLSHEVQAKDKLIFDEGLFVVGVQFEEFIKHRLLLAMLLTKLPVVLSREAILIACSFAFATKLLYLLRIDAALLQIF